MSVFAWLSRALSGMAARRVGDSPAEPVAAPTLAADGNRAVLPHVVVPITASDRFARCVAIVLHHEGGLVNHPRDPGGVTNRGITIGTLRKWRGQDVSPEDVAALTEAEARAIYRARYWNPVKGDELPPGVDLAVFDFAVNSGTGRAARALQGVVGVQQDGAIGPRTLAAVRVMDPREVVTNLCDGRLVFLRSLRHWDTFGRGWGNRVADVRQKALAMAGTRG